MPTYEYQTFTEPIVGGKKNVYDVDGWPLDGGVPSTKGASLANDIEAAVDRLLARHSPEGWEPTEAIDANSLYRAKHVTTEYKGSMWRGDRVIATDVRIRFRRPAGQRPATDASNASIRNEYEKGFMLIAEGHQQEALAAFDRAVALDPNNVAAWYMKGGVLAYLGRQQEALTAYDGALALDPNYADAWIGKGEVLAALGRLEEALAAFDRAVALDPNNADAWSDKGAALGVLGRLEEALAAFDRALALDPSNADAWGGKAAALEGLGREAEAREAERQAKALEKQ